MSQTNRSKILRQKLAETRSRLRQELEHSEPGPSGSNNELVQNIGNGFVQLHFYAVAHIFKFLNIKDKLKFERVSKEWQRAARETLLLQRGLSTTVGEESRQCSKADGEHNVSHGDIRDLFQTTTDYYLFDFTKNEVFERLEVISQKCPKIKCFHLNHALIDGNTFPRLMSIFPNLECIHWKYGLLNWHFVNEVDGDLITEEYNVIGSVIGSRIRHLFIDSNYDYKIKEIHMENLTRHLKVIEEFRIGDRFHFDVSGMFLNKLSTSCKLFYSYKQTLQLNSLRALVERNGENIKYLAFHAPFSNTCSAIVEIGQGFLNLVKLEISLDFNRAILNRGSPIKNLKSLKSLTINFTNWARNQQEDGLIWLIKDGIPSLKKLELKKMEMNWKAFNAIVFCLPEIKELILKSIEVDCSCYDSIRKDRTERFSCTFCKTTCWRYISNLPNLETLHMDRHYIKIITPQIFQNELVSNLPSFKKLRHLFISFQRIRPIKEFYENINQLMENTKSISSRFTLELRNVPYAEMLKSTSKIYVKFHEYSMLDKRVQLGPRPDVDDVPYLYLSN